MLRKASDILAKENFIRHDYLLYSVIDLAMAEGEYQVSHGGAVLENNNYQIFKELHFNKCKKILQLPVLITFCREVSNSLNRSTTWTRPSIF